MNEQIHVVGAVIIADGAVLCVRRGPDGSLPGMWEFPGGKIERGESPQAALEREIREELLCSIAVGEQVTTISHEYDFGVVHLTTYFCVVVSGSPRLVEHVDMLWCEPSELRRLEWAAADIPTVEVIEQRLLRTRSSG